jgi:hypothetical protein
MKKILLAMIGLISFTQSSYSQNENQHKSGFGFKGGLNLSNVHTQKDTPLPFEKDSEKRLGLHAGIFAEIFVNEDRKIAIQPEVVYSEDGYVIKDFNYKDKSGELEYTLNTINLPILFKYYFTKNFNVFVGPQAVYQICSKYDFKGNEIEIEDAGYSRRISSTNLDVVSGLELSTVVGLSINARYIHGTHTMYKQRENLDITRRGFQIGIGYKF